MDIAKVKTATKIGHFSLRSNSPNKIQLHYEAPNPIITGDLPRIYLFVEDKIIKKIGGSSARGGIKATMSFYVNAMQGSPGPSRVVLHLLIERALRNGSDVDLYMITSPSVVAPVNGLFETHNLKVSSFKEMEDICKQDYFKIESRYPDWNFQENGAPYPTDLARQHNEYHQRRLA
jgi:hypothetical protein